MENDILDSLEDFGYDGPLLDGEKLSAALDEGAKSVDYTNLVEWLTKTLQDLCSLEEHVNAIKCAEDSSNFMLELSGFLREFGCPYRTLSDGPVSQRLSTRESRLQLLDYLITEFAATRMVLVNKPGALDATTTTTSSGKEEIESDTAKHLKLMLIALGFPKPPDNITSFQLFSKLEAKIQENLNKCPPSHLGQPLMKGRLSDKQWTQVLQINQELAEEYQLRREMLLKRLDVTIQSFLWSDKAKSKDNEIAEKYQPIRKALSPKSNVTLAQIMAARDDLTKLQKTSSGKAREKTKCAINKVKIGYVPDRGGRAWELEPPPPEMPSFMKRSDAPQQQRQFGGRGGRGDNRRGGGADRGGGRVQGGWGNSNQGQSYGGNWNQGGGGYNQGGRGHNQGYNQQGGYNNQQGGYNNQQGGYNNQQGGYNNQQGGYNNQQGGYNQNYSDRGRGGGRGRGRGGRGGRGRGGY